MTPPKQTHKRIFENDTIAIVNAKHGTFAYLKNDMFVGRSLETYGEWTEPELYLLETIVQPGDIVVDVGAFIGTHTIFFGKKTAPVGNVYAIEPQRLAYNILCTNVVLNSLPNVVCINAFASNKKGEVKVPYLNPEIQQNFGAIHIKEMNQGETVPVITIDSLNLPHCKLIKVDVEEHEVDVLDGANETINKYKPMLYVENNTTERSKEIIEKIYSYDYKCYWHILDYYQPNNYFKFEENIFQGIRPEVNMICLPTSAKVEADGFMEVEGTSDNWRKVIDRYLTSRSKYSKK